MGKIRFSTVKTFRGQDGSAIRYADVGKGGWVRLVTEARPGHKAQITRPVAKVLSARRGCVTLAYLRETYGREIATTK